MHIDQFDCNGVKEAKPFSPFMFFHIIKCGKLKLNWQILIEFWTEIVTSDLKAFKSLKQSSFSIISYSVSLRQWLSSNFLSEVKSTLHCFFCVFVFNIIHSKSCLYFFFFTYTCVHWKTCKRSFVKEIDAPVISGLCRINLAVLIIAFTALHAYMMHCGGSTNNSDHQLSGQITSLITRSIPVCHLICRGGHRGPWLCVWTW